MGGRPSRQRRTTREGWTTHPTTPIPHYSPLLPSIPSIVVSCPLCCVAVVMWCVVLSISDIYAVLIILGGLQISAVIVALLVLMLPILLVDTEPRLRMLKWSATLQLFTALPPLPSLLTSPVLLCRSVLCPRPLSGFFPVTLSCGRSVTCC